MASKWLGLMDDFRQLKIDDLQRLCSERQEETLALEFKSCNELKVGTNFYDKTGQLRPRQIDDVLDELTKDVTAFLNATGGTIIYGIQEKSSRAKKIDKANSFKLGSRQDNIPSEKVVDWLRAHVQPPPTINVYRVLETPDTPDSSWYLVIEIPQGQQAYMARDRRFYKRVGSTAQPMEQYEVSDVMNRTRAAALELRIGIRGQSRSKLPNEWIALPLDVEITSTNFIASEYGALKLIAAYPIKLINQSTQIIFRSSHFESSTGLILEGEDYTPNAQSVMIRWGAHTGNIIFPGDWYNFYGNPISVDVPNLSLLPNPTYLLQTELFTMNSQSKKALFAVRQQPSTENLEIFAVDALNYSGTIASFWETYHIARGKLQQCTA